MSRTILGGWTRCREAFRRKPGPDRLRQRLLPAFERSARWEQRFKWGIFAATLLVLAGIVVLTPPGRYVSSRTSRRLNWAALGFLGIEPPRAEIDADLAEQRRRGIEATRRTYRDFFKYDARPGLRHILTAARMGPDEVLLRWANIDWTIVFSPLVFEADNHGRAYRMRPNVRSFWLQDHVMTRGLTSFFFLPDTPEVRRQAADYHEPIMPESYQTTNSWGCRGPEPDPNAPRRGLILGDSFMQGIFVLDHQTPAEYLRRFLERAWGERVSLLNTGHIGYSPEQYYATLCEYFDRIRPQFVVLSVCPNDFGGGYDVVAGRGRGDWSEAQYWLDEIDHFCRRRQVPCLLVAAPWETQVVGPRNEGYYPGRASNLWKEAAFDFLDPTDDFVDAHLRLMAEAVETGRRPQHSPLFNGHLYDVHFSPQGSAVWGEAVGRRLVQRLAFLSAGKRERTRAPSQAEASQWSVYPTPVSGPGPAHDPR